MQNPDLLVQRALETLEVAEASGLQFVEVKLADVSKKHWRGKTASLLPVSTGSPEIDAEPVEAVKAPEGLVCSHRAIEEPSVASAVSALAAKFKTPKIEAAKSTQPAKIAKATAVTTESVQVVARNVDKTNLEQPTAPCSSPEPVRVEKTEVAEVAPIAPVPVAPTVDTVIDVGEFGKGTIPVESPDVPLTKKKRKRKKKVAKAAETGSAMAWTMRR